MGDDERPGLLDELVELVAKAMDAVGLNGRRLRWQWSRRKIAIAEKKASASVMLRSAKGRHKMCRSCRSLVPRSARECPECGESLAEVRAPGISRLIGNLFPGISTATSILLLVNGFWFVLMLIAQLRSGSTQGLGLMSAFDLELLVRFGGGLSRPMMLPDGIVTGGEWWRLVTPIFLHGGLLHFFFNSYVLLQLGPISEEIYGTKKFWVIYLSCGIVGSAFSQLPRLTVTVGASGAIIGLMGLLLVYGWKYGGVLGQTLKSAMIRYGIYILVISFVLGSSMRMDHLGHLGGFLCGALMGLVVAPATIREKSAGVVWDILAVAGSLVVLYSFYQVAQVAGQ